MSGRATVRGQRASFAEWIIFIGVFVTGAYFIQGGSWSPNARFDLVRSVVESSTFDCAALRYNSGDLVERDGRWLPYKAPGVSLAAIPLWAAIHGIGGGRLSESREGLGLGAYLITLWTTTLPVAWAAAWFFRFCRNARPGLDGAAAGVAAATFGGTLLLPISTLLLGHATAAALCWIAFARAMALTPDTKRGAGVLGLLLASAVAVEYLTLPAAVAISILALKRGGRHQLRGMLVGALPVLTVLGAYHWAFFGAPWRIAYDSPPEAFASERALWGLFLAPSPHVIWQTTFGAYRGLFYSSPFLIAGACGLFIAWRKAAALRGAVLVSAFIVAVNFLFLWTFNGWHGGWTCGVRYFVPAIPFLAWGALFVDGALRKLVWLAATVSVGMMLIATAVNPQSPNLNPDEGRPKPWNDYLVPAFLRGDVADQVQSVDEKYPDYRYWPWGRVFAVPDPDARRQIDAEFPPEIFNPRHPDMAGSATNWGLMFGLDGLWSLLPLVGVWALLGWALRVALRSASPKRGMID